MVGRNRGNIWSARCHRHWRMRMAKRAVRLAGSERAIPRCSLIVSAKHNGAVSKNICVMCCSASPTIQSAPLRADRGVRRVYGQATSNAQPEASALLTYYSARPSHSAVVYRPPASALVDETYCNSTPSRASFNGLNTFGSVLVLFSAKFTASR